MKRVLVLASTLVATLSAWSAEGMWTLDNLPIKAMQQEIGWAPTSAWVDKAMRGSARLAGGCSASFVSKSGLLLTNHHCVAECLEQISSAGRDFLAAGVVARRPQEETACPAMEVDRLEQISDVTATVAESTRGLEGAAYKAARNAVEARLASDCVGSSGNRLRCEVVDLYHGGQYKLYRYRRFQDVRLAFAPEESVANFGGDPDNFNFPRFDLDMALLRVYDDGRPLATRDFFAVSATGPAAGEPVFSIGNPGTTERELTVAQLASLRDGLLLQQLLRDVQWRGTLVQYRTTSAEAARIAASELFFVENGVKATKGQLQALHEPDLFQRKQADEAALRRYVAGQPALAASTGGAWDAIAAAQTIRRELAPQRGQFRREDALGGRTLQFARRLVTGAAERTKPNAERLPRYTDAQLPELEAELLAEVPFHPSFEQLKMTFGLTNFREVLGVDSPLVKKVLGKESPEQMAQRIVAGTKLGDVAERRRLWAGGVAAIAASEDPAIRLAVLLDADVRALDRRYEREVEAVVQKNTELIARARFAMLGDGIYPDATSTPRLSYGVVAGWNEAGVPVPPFTTMGGTFDRATGADPFKLSPSWLAAKTRLDPSVRFNFASTNDVVGGNSGSPVLDRQGDLVGLVFDGNIHSLGGSYWFDPALNRTVSVDSAAILEALDKVYDAGALAAELRGR